LTVIFQAKILRLSGEQRNGASHTPRHHGAIMTIELVVPEDWSPGQALAWRQLLQQAMRTAQPVITLVRKDVTADQLKEIYDRIDALIREAGLQPT
jgi:hypothetical protein